MRIADSKSYGPPLEVVFDSQSSPSPRALRACVSRTLEVPLEHLCIAKQKHEAFQWILISEDHSKTSKKKKGKKGSGVNLKNSPFLLKDGDIIGVKDLREDDVGERDNFDTAEDLKGRAILEAVQEHKRQQRKSKGPDWTQGASSKQRRPEVGIKIHIPNFKKQSTD
jgi:ubiquitin carboxyl-terminal hydrolase 40